MQPGNRAGQLDPIGLLMQPGNRAGQLDRAGLDFPAVLVHFGGRGLVAVPRFALALFRAFAVLRSGSSGFWPHMALASHGSGDLTMCA